MKNFKKTSFIIYICFLVCFCFLTILGIKTKWGSSVNSHLKGVDSINWGDDLKDMVSIYLSFEKNPTQTQQEEVEKILKKRLDLLGFEKNEIYSKRNGRTILINMPASYHKQLFDFSDIANYLISKGELKIVKTTENPLDSLMQQAPKKDNKEQVLANSSAVYSANLLYDDSKRSKMNSSNKIASIRLNMYEQDKEKLLDIYKESTRKRKQLFELKKEVAKNEKELKKLKEDLDEKDKEQKKQVTEKEKKIDGLKGEVKTKEEDISSQNIKILLDQNVVYNSNVLGLINDKFEVVASNFQNNPSKVLGFVNIINSQKLPVDLKIEKISKYSPDFGPEFLDNLTICAAIFILLVLILIGFKYRLFFALALFVFGLHFAFFVCVFTGVFPFFPGVCASFGSVFGIFVSFLIAMFTFILNIDQIFKGVKNKKNLTLCVEQTFKNNKFLIWLNLIILTTSTVLMGCFAPSIDMFYYIFKPLSSLVNTSTQSFIFSFSHALFFGSIATLLFELLTTNICLKLLDWLIYYVKIRKSIKKDKPKKKPKIKKPKVKKDRKVKLTKKMEAKPNEAKI